MPPSEMVSFRLGSEVRSRVTAARSGQRESDWMREAVHEKLLRDLQALGASTGGDEGSVTRATAPNLAGRTEQFRRAAEAAAIRRKSGG